MSYSCKLCKACILHSLMDMYEILTKYFKFAIEIKFFTMALNIDDFIKKIEDEFDELEPGKLKPESAFRQMFDWNSINALVLIAMVKTEYNVTINADDLTKSKTVKDIFKIIESRYHE